MAHNSLMSNMLIVKGFVENNELKIVIESDERITRKRTLKEYETFDADGLFLYWTLNAIKPAFSMMPVKRLSLDFQAHFAGAVGHILYYCEKLLKNTNEMLLQYDNLKDIGKQNEKILFFNAGKEWRFQSFYEKVNETCQEKILTRNMDTGYDPISRCFQEVDVPIPIEDFVELIILEKIEKIVSINMYLLERYLQNTTIYLPALFHHLGVEYIIMDLDPWDETPMGHLVKALFHMNQSKRFSLGYIFNNYWNNKHELRNVTYMTIPQEYDENTYFESIEQDYSIIVLSNSRLGYVKAFIASIIYLLDHMNDNTVFREIQLWYLSIRRFILQDRTMDEFEKLHYNSVVYNIFFATMQFLKFEIIEGIRSERKIEIYGDTEWGTLFPRYYKRYLSSDEQAGLFSQKRHLHLIFNYGFTTLNGSGPFHDAVRRNTPFINIPLLAKADEFQGIKHIEYGNEKELNELVNDFNPIIENDELKKSMQSFKKVARDSVAHVKRMIGEAEPEKDNGDFEELCREEVEQLSMKIDGYEQRNETFIRNTFQELCLEFKTFRYNITTSRYFSRTYMQRLLHSMQHGK